MDSSFVFLYQNSINITTKPLFLCAVASSNFTYCKRKFIFYRFGYNLFKAASLYRVAFRYFINRWRCLCSRILCCNIIVYGKRTFIIIGLNPSVSNIIYPGGNIFNFEMSVTFRIVKIYVL